VSSYHIGSVNAQNAQIGDHNTQHNTQVSMHDELAKLGATIDRHASLVPDMAAAHRALDALRVAYTARPVDGPRATKAVRELTAATAAVPAVNATIARLFGPISS
jgi:hypothetical protein